MSSDHNVSATHASNASEGSKFKRFLKKFGRKPSDEAVPSPANSSAPPLTTSSPIGQTPHDDTLLASGHLNSKNGAKPFKSRNKSAYAANGTSTRSEGPNASSPTAEPQRAPSPMNFSGTSGQGLADTLVMPQTGAGQPPQLASLPTHGPIDPSELPSVSNGGAPVDAFSPLVTGNAQSYSAVGASIPAFGDATNPEPIAVASRSPAADQNDGAMRSIATSSSLAVEEQVGGNRAAAAAASAPIAVPPSSYGRTARFSDHSTSPTRSGAGTSFEDVDSTEGFRRRDSSETRTVDTGKSTKPTTLMSLDTRENTGQSNMAHIAQHRHGEQSSPTSQARAAGGSPSIQFASSPNTGRGGASGAVPLVNLPGYGDPSEEIPYTNVPAISRPHPSNNPTPSGIPADNASVLTLASSTATHSIGTGTPSVRHGGGGATTGYHYTPSLGGPRSIGGSLMGDRRNSSDTYASVRALPPLSRRGSDASTRTGKDSFAPTSAAGLTSANAMTTNGTSGGTGPSLLSSGANTSSSNIALNATGTGAPADRMGIKRTDSQRTVATQLSIPLSVSASNHAAFLNPSSDRRGSSGSANLLGVGGAVNSHREVAIAGLSTVPSAVGPAAAVSSSAAPLTGAPSLAAATPVLTDAGTDVSGSGGNSSGEQDQAGTGASIALVKPEMHHVDSAGGQMLKMAEEGHGDRIGIAPNRTDLE